MAEEKYTRLMGGKPREVRDPEAKDPKDNKADKEKDKKKG